MFESLQDVDVDLWLKLWGYGKDYVKLHPIYADHVAAFLQFIANQNGIKTGELKGRYLDPCENGCGFVHPYGFAPQAGCPIHDPPNDTSTTTEILDSQGRTELEAVTDAYHGLYGGHLGH